jgi:hypothetical protein
MKAGIRDSLQLLAEFGDSADVRAERIESVTRSIKKRAREAIAEEQRYAILRNELQEIGDELGESERKAREQRLRIVHQARCASIKEVASLCRRAMTLACGDLVIDDATAATGLPPDERRLVHDVLSGRGDK